MKRIRVLIVLILAFSLTGCIQQYTATVEQSNAVADYMAGLLLESDKYFGENLIPEEELIAAIEDNQVKGNEEEKDESAVTVDANNTDEVPGGNDNTKNNAAHNNSSVTKVIGLEGFDIKYSGYELAEVYPEDMATAGFSLDARDGYQFLITFFTISNTSGKQKTFNLIKADITYHLDINAGTVYEPLLTLLENDLQYIDITLDGKESKTALLVFEISKSTAVTNVNLSISNNNKTNIIEIE